MSRLFGCQQPKHRAWLLPEGCVCSSRMKFVRQCPLGHVRLQEVHKNIINHHVAVPKFSEAIEIILVVQFYRCKNHIPHVD